MKRTKIVIAMLTSVLAMSFLSASAVAEEAKEITFRDISWGTSYTTVNDAHGEWSLMPMSGDWCVTPSVDAVLMDNSYEGIDFEYTDINIVASALNGELDVAGYTTSELWLYFSYTSSDGILSKEESDSALYGATYKFETKNLEEMAADLTAKLSSIYGDPERSAVDTDIWGNKYTYTYWSGANDTELCLKKTDSINDSTGFYNDEIAISYAWRKGDELLQEASDILAQEAIDAESSVYGNSNTNGL